MRLSFLPNILSLSVFISYWIVGESNTDYEDGKGSQRYKIEGKIIIPYTNDQDWLSTTRILIDGGKHIGLMKGDGSFVVSNIASGSYILEVSNPGYAFEPARIDINSKGKIRARRLNNLQPSQVQHITYPLKLKARGMATYFQKREQWRITDMLMNPMVLMMVLPFLMIMVLPKLINTADPDTQKELQSQMNFMNPKQGMPDISEMVTNFFGGTPAAKKQIKPKPSNKRRS